MMELPTDHLQINVIANIILLIAKIAAAFTSSSLSLIASLVDSALDLLCTLIIWTTNKLVQWKIRRLQHKFPVGRRRLEPLGILVFSIIMIVSFLQILQESVTKLLPGGPRDAATLPPVAIGALVATIVIKGVIWFGCIRVQTTQVQALAQGTPSSLPPTYPESANEEPIRLQDRRRLQHPVPPLPTNRTPALPLVARPRRRRPPLPLHHLRLVRNLLRKRRPPHRLRRRPQRAQKGHLPRLAFRPRRRRLQDHHGVPCRRWGVGGDGYHAQGGDEAEQGARCGGDVAVLSGGLERGG